MAALKPCSDTTRDDSVTNTEQTWRGYVAGLSAIRASETLPATGALSRRTVVTSHVDVHGTT